MLLGVAPARGPKETEEDLAELSRLADTAGAIVVARVTQRRDHLDPGYFIGRGKADEIREMVGPHDVDVVICDEDLSPGQVRNLEKIIGVKVVDRSELILDIFATRARTKQARLQVELAQLEYTLPRLKRMWTHLNRYEGGIGTRGPGEKQLESDRRMVQKQIADLKHELKAIDERKMREVGSRKEFPLLSIVGYTNAGKSTLMNALTDAGVLVEDKLFATLDTRTRRWKLDKHFTALVSDTVGFIRKLPHHLVASFRATLEEARHADLLLHVVDASHPEAMSQAEVVLETLNAIGCQDTPKLTVLNKEDLIEDPLVLVSLQRRFRDHVLVSALSGKGLERLRERVLEICTRQMVEVEIQVPVGDGRIHAMVTSEGRVLQERHTSEMSVYRALIKGDVAGRLRAMGATVRSTLGGKTDS